MGFQWRLQRLLDITGQKELALRAELFALARQAAHLRQQIAARQAVHRMLLADLGRQGLSERIGQQDVFMGCLPWEQRRILRLQGQLEALRKQRQEKTRQLLRTKSRRETLEKLREEAWRRFVREQSRREQKELDDMASVGFNRRHADRAQPRQ